MIYIVNLAAFNTGVRWGEGVRELGLGCPTPFTLTHKIRVVYISEILPPPAQKLPRTLLNKIIFIKTILNYVLITHNWIFWTGFYYSVLWTRWDVLWAVRDVTVRAANKRRRIRLRHQLTWTITSWKKHCIAMVLSISSPLFLNN